MSLRLWHSLLETTLFGYQRVDRGRLRFAMNHDAIARDALENRPRFFGNTAAGYVVLRCHDFKTRELQFAKSILGNRSNRTGRDSLALAGLPYPIANVSEVLAPVQLIDPDPAQ